MPFVTACICLEKLGYSTNYSKITTTTQVLLPATSFSSLEELLPKSRFARLYRSFIVNKSKITHIEGNMVYIGQQEIPIGSNYKETFLKSLGL